MASRLLEFLMQNAGHSNWQIFKNNLEIIKTLVECWRNKLDIPTKYDYHSTNRASRIYFLLNQSLYIYRVPSKWEMN